MQLSDDQKTAADAFMMFMASPDAEFTISGAAGTGKTTLLRHLRDSKDHVVVCELIGKKPISKWAFTATTNKAADVLRQALGHEAGTIHSFLGLKVRNDYKTGDVVVTRDPKKHEIVRDTVIVIDEASMIDTNLRKLIRESTFNCKIIYVGDHCQMAPVKEPLSPVFADTAPVFLNKVIRSQHTPAITALCGQLRQIVETGVFTKLHGVPGVIDFLDATQAEAEIRAHFIDNKTDSRILAYTNRKVNALNAWLRNERHLPTKFQEGEVVVASNAAFILDSQRDEKTRIEQELAIYAVDPETTETIVVGKTWYEVPCYNVHTSAGMLRIALDPAHLEALRKMFKKAEQWPAYFKCQEDFADLRPIDCCTVYKAQGSTYRDVFVDLTDIGTCTNASQAARMLYVACSRPTDRICFFGALPPRFSGD